MQPSFCLESHVSFNSRPNVRGTLVAVEKAASHSVSLFTIIVWEARSRYKAFQAHLAELLDSRQLIFPFRFIIYINSRSSLPLPSTRFGSYIFAVVGTLPARGPVACELLTLS
jgi:hypothetical protein